MNEFVYSGNELELFSQAVNWKAYFRSHLRSYLHGDVLEVGAGIGANSELLSACSQGRWVCLEPDPQLAKRLSGSLAEKERRQVVVGTLANLAASERFDTILYLDVLEHIADDDNELLRATALLRTGGHLIVLAPALPGLYTRFDKVIGHHRRYTSSSLRAAAPAGLVEVKMHYLDVMGCCASLGNRLILDAEQPTQANIRFWDRVLVPISRLVDPVIGYRLGKSILGVWRRTGAF